MHLGLLSKGLDVVEPRLRHASKERWHDRLARRCVIGVNLGEAVSKLSFSAVLSW